MFIYLNYEFTKIHCRVLFRKKIKIAPKQSCNRLNNGLFCLILIDCNFKKVACLINILPKKRKSDFDLQSIAEKYRAKSLPAFSLFYAFKLGNKEQPAIGIQVFGFIGQRRRVFYRFATVPETVSAGIFSLTFLNGCALR